MDKKAKRTFIADNAPTVKSVPVPSGDEGWGMCIVLYPQPELNNVVIDHDESGHFSVNRGSVFHHRDGVLSYSMRGGSDWDKITSLIPDEVYNTAQEWLEELAQFASERSVRVSL